MPCQFVGEDGKNLLEDVLRREKQLHQVLRLGMPLERLPHALLGPQDALHVAEVHFAAVEEEGCHQAGEETSGPLHEEGVPGTPPRDQDVSQLPGDSLGITPGVSRPLENVDEPWPGHSGKTITQAGTEIDGARTPASEHFL